MTRWLDQGEKFALEALDGQQRWQDYYRSIVEIPAGSPTSDAATPFVGRSVPRNDVLYKVRGRARYAANIDLPGMLHGRFLRSIHPYARIRHIDASPAREVPGVRAVLTGQDIPRDRLYVGSLVQDTPVLARDVVRYVGEPVAVVAAESIEAADEALSRIEVDYDPLEPVLTPEHALAEDAPQLHSDGNTIADLKNEVGDVEDALAESDLVLENTFVNDGIDHCFLESQAGVAYVNEEGVLTLHVCTQYPHFHHQQLSRVTGFPMDKVRVIQSVIGGAFGGKIDVTVECAASLLTIATGAPVKMVLERDEVFTSTTKRHVMRIQHRLGANRDGRFTALDMRIVADGGAYASYSLIVAGRCVIHASLPYDIPNVRAHFTTAFTNHVPAGAMRSFGMVKLGFATETQVNEMAHRLGISPIEIRRINAVRSGTRSVTGQELIDVGFEKTLDAIEEIYEQRRKELEATPPLPGRRRGLGIACLGYGIGYSGVRNPSTARIEVDESGRITANTGTPDIGTGSDTTLAQITADAIGIGVGRIRVVSGDSTRTDDSGPTSASRTTYFSGSAARIAGDDFRNQFEECLADVLSIPREQIRIAGDRVIVSNEPWLFEKACARLGERVKEIRGYGHFNPVADLDLENFKGIPYPTYTYATQLAEVDVDEELGSVSVPRFWAAHDAGNVVNPVGAEGQIQGGVVMGLGMALWERVVREGGYIQNPSYRDYLVPGSLDIPTEITTIFVDNPDSTGPYGAKGVAEASLIPVPAAVGEAVYQALGVRPRHLPMSAERIYDLARQTMDNERQSG